ncbi:MFS transporter [Curtobacterium sp. 1P10AnD]|uniref:MFS transporter n=1 Tax=Curtobacterium sp. 1P10AnD TaxID=3132283 RepID=UPI00399FBF2C
MKRSFSLRTVAFTVSGTALIAVTYGLVRLAYGLFLPDVQRDLDLAAAAAGWVSAGASGCYCIGALAGFLLARAHARSLVVAAALAAATGALGMAASPGTGVFAIAAVVGSASAGLASPALVRLVGERTSRVDDHRDDDHRADEHRAARLQAAVNAGTGPGLVVAGVLALVLLPDWRTAWAWSGIAAVVVGAAVLLTVGRSAGPAPEQRVTPDRAWSRAHVRPVVVALLFGTGTASVWTFGRSVLVDAGAGTTASVLLWVAVGLGGAAVTVTARWTAPLGALTVWRVTVLATAGAVVVLGAFPGAGVLPLVAGAVFGWGYTAGTGALIAWTTEIAPERSAAGTAVLFVVLVLGQAVGAAGLGAVLGVGGPALTFLFAAVVTLLAVAGTVRRRAPGRADLELPPVPGV